MALATVDADGMPNVRMVLLKGLDGPGRPDRGFVFYTNIESAKGREILGQGKAALCFHWKSLRRQVRVRGPGPRLTMPRPMPISPRGRAAAGSAPGPRSSRGRWKAALRWRRRWPLYTARHPIGEIPRPPYWSGFRVVPAGDRVLARPAVPPA